MGGQRRWLGSNCLPLKGKGELSMRRDLRCACTVTIPPRTAKVVELNLSGLANRIVLWDNKEDKADYVAPDCLLDIDQNGKSRSWILNPSEKSIQLWRGQRVGSCLSDEDFEFGSVIGDGSIGRRWEEWKEEGGGGGKEAGIRCSSGTSSPTSSSWTSTCPSSSPTSSKFRQPPTSQPTHFSKPETGDETDSECYTDLIPLCPELSEEQKKGYRRMFRRNKEAFAKDDFDLGCIKNIYHRIQTGDAKPIKSRNRQYTAKEKLQIKLEVEKLRKMGVICEVESPWKANVLLVRKKDNTMRPVVSFIGLNRVIINNDSFPLPRVDWMLRRLGSAKVFSSFDCLCGFWQLRVHPDDVHRTAFAADDKLYAFKRLPMGIVSGPSSWMRAMAVVMADAGPAAAAYMDDLVTVSATVEDNIKDTEKLLQACVKHGVKLKMKKSHVGASKIPFLGVEISSTGISIQEARAQAICEYPAPQCLPQLRRFIGLMEYNASWIPDCSIKLAPLFSLLRKGQKWRWEAEHQQRFEELKEDLKKATSLAVCAPEEKGPLTIAMHTDSSGDGLGAVLSKEVEPGVYRPIAFKSRALASHEKRFAPIELEALAMYWALKVFKPFCHGVKTIVVTDHKPNLQFLSSNNPNARLKKWRDEINEEFPGIEVRWIKGSENIAADALSRIYCSDKRKPSGRSQGQAGREEGRDDTKEEQGEPKSCAMRLRSHGPAEEEAEEGKAEKETEGEELENEERRREEAEKETLELIKNEEWLAEQQGRSETLLKQRDETLAKGGRTRGWAVTNGVIYRIVNGHKVPCIPPQLRPAILAAFHDNVISGGHCSAMRMQSKMTKRVHWKGMGKDCTEWATECSLCAAINPPTKAIVPELKPIIPAAQRFSHFGLDLIGPLPITARGNRYILTITDYLTKGTTLVAMAETTAEKVVEELMERQFSQTGIPRVITSDGASYFLAELTKEFARVMGIRWETSSPHHQSGNGLAEALNKTVIRVLRAASIMEKGLKKELEERAGRDPDWDKLMNTYLMSYRATDHSTTGRSPFELMYGVRMRLPPDTLLETRETMSDSPTTVDGIKENIRKGTVGALARLIKAQERRKKRHDQHVHQPFKVGDRVRRKKEGKRAKMDPKYSGPMEIIRIDDERNHAICRDMMNKDEMPKEYNLSKIKKTSELIPAIFESDEKEKPSKEGKEGERRSPRLEEARKAKNEQYLRAMARLAAGPPDDTDDDDDADK